MTAPNFSNHLYLPDIQPKRCVVKVGSSLLAKPTAPYLNAHRMSNIVRQISILLDNGWQVILVSSGAVAGGMSALGIDYRPEKMTDLQACAAVGQVILMKRYARLFLYKGKVCAQVLLTAEDLRTRSRYCNAKSTIMKLLEHGVVPVVNENDTVSTEEIAFGDNDRLSALVAGTCEAKVLIILSDVDGLYSDLRHRTVVPIVERIDQNIKGMVRKKQGKTTVGGMATKLQAAEIASRWGIYTIVTSGHRKDVLVDLLIRRRHIGTLFLPAKKRTESKKMWIAYMAQIKGDLIIDKGAKEAVVSGGKSLLCAGVKQIVGRFNKGDVVRIVCEGEEIGRGIAGMDSEEMNQFLGKRAHKEAVHRDRLVIWMS